MPKRKKPQVREDFQAGIIPLSKTELAALDWEPFRLELFHLELTQLEEQLNSEVQDKMIEVLEPILKMEDMRGYIRS